MFVHRLLIRQKSSLVTKTLLFSTGAILGALIIPLAQAQSSDQEPLLVSEIADLPEISIIKSLRQTSGLLAAYSLSVISEQDLQEKLVRSLPEALSETPGVLVQKTANGHGSPFIRGFTGYRTLALIDGVRYNNSIYRDGPNEYFSLIDLNTVEQLELLSGPSSVLYGSDAIGGAINLKTKSANHESEWKGKQFVNGSQSYRYASAENSHISRTELQVGEGGSWGLHLGYTVKDFGNIEAAELGTLPHTGYNEHGFDARFDMSLNDQWRFSVVHQQLEQDDVWRTHSTIFSKSFSGTTVGSALKRLKDQKRSLDYIQLAGQNLEGFINQAQLTLSHQRWDEDGERVRSSGALIDDFFDSRMTGIDLQLQSHGYGVDWTYGFDYYQDKVNSGRTDFNPDGSLDSVRIQGPIGDDSQYDIGGAYLQGELSISKRLSLTAGSRYTHTRAKVGRFEDPATNTAASFSDDWDNIVHSLRLSYDLNESGDTKLWGGISQSFRAPNIADLSRFGKSRSTETEVAATDLDPEKFLTYEIGIKTERYPIEFSGTYYYTQIRDFITSTPTGRIVGGLTEVSKRNSADGFIQGIELTGEYAINRSFDVYANISWLEGELDTFADTSTTSSTTEPFSRTMPLTSNLGINWHSPGRRMWASLSVTYAAKADKLSSGDKADTERIPPGGTPSYTLVNLRGGMKINKHLSFTIGLENLLDEVYRSHGSGTNEPGFGINTGVTLSF